mmetsp:Transcript_29368/g.65755  ORF Transcript_29368/g.65755 Transcript_29368/m.65755 type:complete len:214 (-) Transcript_29368:489-1130(-)
MDSRRRGMSVLMAVSSCSRSLPPLSRDPSTLGNSEKLNSRATDKNLRISGKSPGGRLFFLCTVRNTLAISAGSQSFSCFFFMPIMVGMALRSSWRMNVCARSSRIRFTSSFTFRTALCFGKFLRSFKRSSISARRSGRVCSFTGGFSQKLPMYTRTTSGVSNTLPKDHIKAPYTLMSCWTETASALLSTTRILSSFPLRIRITAESSSLMSSL